MNENEKENVTLWSGVATVRALVRPFLAVSLTLAAVYLTIRGLLAPAVIGTAATAVFGFYFGERAALKQPGASTEDRG